MDSERGRIMDFDLAPEYEKLIATVREFGEQHFTCEAVRQWQHDAGLPDEVVRDFVNLDFNGFGVIHRRDHVTYDTMAQTLFWRARPCFGGGSAVPERLSEPSNHGGVRRVRAV